MRRYPLSCQEEFYRVDTDDFCWSVTTINHGGHIYRTRLIHAEKFAQWLKLKQIFLAINVS